MLLDSHCHLNLKPLNHELGEIFESHKDMNMVVVGIDEQTSREAVRLANEHENVFATIGIHPSDICNGTDIGFIDELINNPKVIAVGECGFDFFRDAKDDVIEQQEKVFRAQIEKTLEHSKPLMIHTRSTKFTLDAYEETLRVFEDYRNHVNWRGAQIHFFVGNENYARKFLEMGCMLSFTGVVTLTSEFDSVVSYVPLDKILLETDAPFVSPQKYRGQTCYPKYVEEVYAHVAHVKNMTQGDLEKQILINFETFYQNREI